MNNVLYNDIYFIHDQLLVLLHVATTLLFFTDCLTLYSPHIYHALTCVSEEQRVNLINQKVIGVNKLFQDWNNTIAKYTCIHVVHTMEDNNWQYFIQV